MIEIDWRLVYEAFRYRTLWIVPVIVGIILLILLNWIFQKTKYKNKFIYNYSSSLFIILIGIICFYIEISTLTKVIMEAGRITTEMVIRGFWLSTGPLISSFFLSIIIYVMNLKNIRKL